MLHVRRTLQLAPSVKQGQHLQAFFSHLAAPSPMATATALNVLIYSDDGASRLAVKQAQDALRVHLGSRYAIQTVPARSRCVNNSFALRRACCHFLAKSLVLRVTHTYTHVLSSLASPLYHGTVLSTTALFSLPSLFLFLTNTHTHILPWKSVV